MTLKQADDDLSQIPDPQDAQGKTASWSAAIFDNPGNCDRNDVLRRSPSFHHSSPGTFRRSILFQLVHIS